MERKVIFSTRDLSDLAHACRVAAEVFGNDADTAAAQNQPNIEKIFRDQVARSLRLEEKCQAAIDAG